jgi:hypothetical protein
MLVVFRDTEALISTWSHYFEIKDDLGVMESKYRRDGGFIYTLALQVSKRP